MVKWLYLNGNDYIQTVFNTNAVINTSSNNSVNNNSISNNTLDINKLKVEFKTVVNNIYEGNYVKFYEVFANKMRNFYREHNINIDKEHEEHNFKVLPEIIRKIQVASHGFHENNSITGKLHSITLENIDFYIHSDYVRIGRHLQDSSVSFINKYNENNNTNLTVSDIKLKISTELKLNLITSDWKEFYKLMCFNHNMKPMEDFVNKCNYINKQVSTQDGKQVSTQASTRSS